MATAGIGAEDYLEPGTAITVPGAILEAVIEEGRTIYREDIAEDRYPEEAGLLALGVRARVLAPLQLGTRSIGALAISRTEPASFREEEIALVTLLGRLVATAVQNLRTYEAERATVEELRRLSVAPRRLRLARLARAPQPDGGRDRLRPHAAGALARAEAGAARGVPRRDRGRDDAARGARRRRARHLADRGRHLRLPLRRRRPGRGSARLGRRRRDRPGRGASVDGAADRAAERARRRGAAASARRQPDLERDQVLGLRRRGHRRGQAPTTATWSSTSATRARDRAWSTRPRSSRSSAASPAPRSRGPGLGLFLSRSFAEAHGGSLDVESTPGEGAVFTLRLPAG